MLCMQVLAAKCTVADYTLPYRLHMGSSAVKPRRADRGGPSLDTLRAKPFVGDGLDCHCNKGRVGYGLTQ
jgi:hypothetical protein